MGYNSAPVHAALRAPLFKYSLRMWVFASLRAPSSVWIYKEGYVSLAMQEFTAAPDAMSHITNLRGKAAGGSAVVAEDDVQRRFSLSDFSSYLDLRVGMGTYENTILPGVRNILCELFRALEAPPSALAPEGAECGKRLRRFGFDFLVDEALKVWLIEVNILKDGYAVGYAQKGAAGDDKRRLVQQLIADEAKLRTYAKANPGSEHTMPDTFEQVLPRPCSGNVASGPPSLGEATE